MSDTRGSNGGGSFNDFCQGYLLGLEDHHTSCQQNTSTDLDMGNMELGQAFADPITFSTDSPEDPLAGDLFYEQPQDGQAGDLLFEHFVNAELPLTLNNPFYRHPVPQHGQNIPPNTHAPMLPDPLFSHCADFAHPDPLVPAENLFLPTTANGFAGMNGMCVEDLILPRPEPLDESCDLALSDAGDVNTDHYYEQGNWDEGEEMIGQRGALSYLPSQSQLPPSSPEEHPTIPCGREECHICEVFSLPF